MLDMQILTTLYFVFLSILLPFPHEPNRVEREQTPISTVKLAQVLKEGHHEVFGYYPSDNRLAVGWAQVAIENGQGRKVYNYNLGNINSAKSRPYYVKHNRFKAHQSFRQGAKDYWKIVKKLCRTSLVYFDAGAAYQAALQMKRCGYYTANEKKYGKSMSKLYFKAIKKVIPQME